MNDTTLIQDMAVKREEWQKEIMKFRIIAEVAEPDAQIQHYQIIEDIVTKEQAVVEKMKEYQESEAVDRSALHRELVRLKQRVDEAIEAARVAIN